MDGTFDFFKNWVYYKLGFGSLENECWLGNEKIHRLTKRKNMMIRFDLEDFDENKAYTEYKALYIDGENDSYSLHVSSYSGTAEDLFSFHTGNHFSTKDRGATYPFYKCATSNQGACWYSECTCSNLNGKYDNNLYNKRYDAVIWYDFKNRSLKRAEMKVRPVA